MKQLRAVPFVVAALAIAPAAHASLVFIENGNALAAQYYHVQTYGEIKDSNGNNLQDNGTIRSESAPIGPSSQSFTLSQSGSSLTSTTSAVMDGFARTRTSATAQITNASNIQGYTSVGSYGMRTQIQFNASQTPGRVVFNFGISGSASAPFGAAIDRLDFLARGSPSGSFFDVFGNGALHATGTGNFSFTYTGSTASPLDVLFYSAAAVLVGTSGFPSASNGANFTAFANFTSTFDLTSIQLYTVNDELIPEWTLTDLANNAVVFNQAGRIEAIPEPGTLGLLAVGLTGLWIRRQQR